MAQANLGAMYENGEGVAADNAEAVTWYRKATEQGVSTAQCSLKQVYEQGEGEVIDKFLAFLLCQKLAKEGNEDAQELLNRLKAD